MARAPSARHAQSRSARSAEKTGFDKATIVDVAEAAGVSYATVSRVVNNKDNVADETRERVLAAMRELGYQANIHARRLVSGRSNVIGILFHNLISQYLAEILQGVEDALSVTDFDLMLYSVHRREASEARSVSMLSGGLADGLLITLPNKPQTYTATLRQRGYPFVLIDHKGSSPDDVSVIAANWQGGFDATQYLLQLGHRRIGLVTGNMAMDSAVDRLAGYRAALAAASIAYDPALVFEGDYHQPNGIAGGH
jgi:LacI family transcriptional regulator